MLKKILMISMLAIAGCGCVQATEAKDEVKTEVVACNGKGVDSVKMDDRKDEKGNSESSVIFSMCDEDKICDKPQQDEQHLLACKDCQ